MSKPKLYSAVDEAVQKMLAFIERYNQAHENLKKELAEELRQLIKECAEKLEQEKIIAKMYG